MIKTECDNCKKVFEKKPAEMSEKNYCSCSCYHEATRGVPCGAGRIRTDLHCEHLRKSLKGHVPWNRGKRTGIVSRNAFKKGQIPWNKGKPFLRLAANPNWKGGKSFEPYSPEFNDRLKKQVLERDGHRCQQCFRHQKELGYEPNIHHIDFDKQNNAPENLISLCSTCHGQTNFDRDDWTEYFQNKVNER